MSVTLTRRTLLGFMAAFSASCVVGRARAQQPAPAGALPLPSLIVDAHCHIFSVLDLPMDGFAVALGHGRGAPDGLDPFIGLFTSRLHQLLNCIAELRSGQPDEPSCRDLLAMLGISGQSLQAPQQVRAVLGRLLRSSYLYPLVARLPEGKVSNIAGALEIATRPRFEIAEQLCRDYPKTQLFLPALVDYKYWDARGRRSKPKPSALDLDKQITEHAKTIAIINARAGSAKLHAYVPFNPLRLVRFWDGKERVCPLQQVRRAIGVGGEAGLGFVGVKLYPPNGFAPLGNTQLRDLEREGLGDRLDAAMHLLFRLCEREQIPILSHTSLGNAFGPDYGHRAGPRGWRAVLEQYPNLRLNLGHFGQTKGLTSSEIVLDCLSWSKQVAFLMKTYPHVYADISNSDALLKPGTEMRNDYLEYLSAELWPVQMSKDASVVERRVLFGTDWWMLRLEPNFDRYTELVRDALSELADAVRPPAIAANLLQRVMGENAREFLGLKTAERLRGYYARWPGTTPSWLSDWPQAVPPPSEQPTAGRH